MYKRALKMRRYGRGLEVWAAWGGGGNRATGEGCGRACSVFLLTIFFATTSLTPCS